MISSQANLSVKKRIRFEDKNDDLKVVQYAGNRSSLHSNATNHHQPVTPQHRRLKTDIDRLNRRLTGVTGSFNQVIPEQQRSSYAVGYQ